MTQDGISCLCHIKIETPIILILLTTNTKNNNKDQPHRHQFNDFLYNYNNNKYYTTDGLYYIILLKNYTNHNISIDRYHDHHQ